MIDTILWDVDGTLLNFKKSEHDAIKLALEQIDYHASEDDIALYSRLNDACWKKHELNQMERERVFAKRFEDFFGIVGIKTDIDAFNEIYLEFLGKIYFYIDDSLEILKKLKGIRQYAVTNGHAKAQLMKLNASGISDVLDGIFISGDIGCPKPEPRFFDACFEKIGNVRRENTLIVGDSLSSDIRGGNNAKIRCCWYNPELLSKPNDLYIDAEITSLTQIYDVLKSL